jgi:quinol monooxygenase YgiN
MATFELSAHMTVRPGQLEGFKKQAAEIIRLTKERDTQTLRYDWFLTKDGTDVRSASYTPARKASLGTKHTSERHFTNCSNYTPTTTS